MSPPWERTPPSIAGQSSQATPSGDPTSLETPSATLPHWRSLRRRLVDPPPPSMYISFCCLFTSTIFASHPPQHILHHGCSALLLSKRRRDRRRSKYTLEHKWPDNRSSFWRFGGSKSVRTSEQLIFFTLIWKLLLDGGGGANSNPVKPYIRRIFVEFFFFWGCCWVLHKLKSSPFFLFSFFSGSG
ncbi:hypothetical protein ABFS83_02G045900 [Erythranthe nasuta]